MQCIVFSDVKHMAKLMIVDGNKIFNGWIFQNVKSQSVTRRYCICFTLWACQWKFLMRNIDIAVLSVCPSITFCYSVETAKHFFIVSSPHGSPIISLWASSKFVKFRQGHPMRGTKYRWGCNVRPVSRYISQTIQDSTIVTMEGE